MLTRKLLCPSCGVKLKVADTLPPGKKIPCPKCREPFAIPAEESDPELEVVEPAPRRKPAPPLEDNDPEDRPRPMRRKRKKRPPKKTSNRGLVVGLIVGGVVLIGGGAAATVAFWPSTKQASVAVSNNASPSAPVPTRSETAPRPRRRPSAPPSAPTAKSNSGANTLTVGQTVFESKCSRCHGTPGSGQRSRAPDLSHTGGVPGHTADWLISFVRNPKAVKPGAHMPAFEGRIKEADLQALGEYLASLK